MPRSGSYDVHLRLGPMLHKIRLLCLAKGYKSVSAYIRNCIERCSDEDMKNMGGTRLYMRPDQPVYSVKEYGSEKEYTVLTRTLGGERCWVIRSIGYLPAGAGGALAMLVDLTVEPGNSGCSATSVVVPIDGVIGAE